MIFAALAFVLIFSVLYMLTVLVVVIGYLATRKYRDPHALSTRLLYGFVTGIAGAPLAFIWIATALGLVEDWPVSSFVFDNPGVVFALVFVLVSAIAFWEKGRRG